MLSADFSAIAKNNLSDFAWWFIRNRSITKNANRGYRFLAGDDDFLLVLYAGKVETGTFSNDSLEYYVDSSLYFTQNLTQWLQYMQQ